MESVLSDERAVASVELLPASVRSVLARGPVPQGPEGDDDPDGDCRVCAAFDPWLYGGPTNGRGYRLEVDAPRQSRRQRRVTYVVALLDDWHRGWDLHDRQERLDQRGVWLPERFVLGCGTECFRRCVVIYRAAGWTGKVLPA